MSLFTILSVMCAAQIAFGYPQGAPKSACLDLRPKHGVDPQPNPSHYEFHVNTQDLHPGAKVPISLLVKSPHPQFKGFIIQVVMIL